MPDEALAGLARSGNPDAFEEMVERHSDAAFSLAFRMCGQRGTAEDIVQDAFLSLWRTGARYDPTRGTIRSWVLGTVHNRAVDRFRNDAVHCGRDVVDDAAVQHLPSVQDTAGEVCRRDDARHVRGAVRDLPHEQRRVIELAYFKGYSHSQIAELLTLPAGTVKGRLRLGLTKLKLALGEPPDA